MVARDKETGKGIYHAGTVRGYFLVMEILFVVMLQNVLQIHRTATQKGKILLYMYVILQEACFKNLKRRKPWWDR